jgi:hypothetical protein
MPRALSPAFLAAIESSAVRPAIFVESNFTSGPLYAWTGLGSIDWNGHTWLGVGSLGSISTIEEGSDVNAKGITIGLSGIDPVLLTGVVSEFQTGLPVTVYFGLFDASMALIADPVISFQGRMDQPTLDVDGQTASISINCENRLLDMNVSVERRYTNEDQQLDYPGDRGFEFVNSIQEVAINWGRTPSTKG